MGIGHRGQEDKYGFFFLRKRIYRACCISVKAIPDRGFNHFFAKKYKVFEVINTKTLHLNTE
ncbi:MAG: hypothetical protein F6K47_14440 [Symploca sp. SIO2E6]|nr:hypothetical protein [Symploca sp. SIO2E6]